MANGKVLGQNQITQHFENAIKMGKISHAYIINGEAESGKMELALQFAKALQCEDNNIRKTPTELLVENVIAGYRQIPETNRI